jgi:hypothetical protein
MSRLQGEDTGLSGNQDTEPSERRKLPIPRLPSRHIQPPKTRVSRACQSCQQQKTKCDGKKPSCYHCLELSIHCVYLNNKREKTRELVEHLITKNKHLEASLDRVMKEATNSTAQPVQETLKVWLLFLSFLCLPIIVEFSNFQRNSVPTVKGHRHLHPEVPSTR